MYLFWPYPSHCCFCFVHVTLCWCVFVNSHWFVWLNHFSSLHFKTDVDIKVFWFGLPWTALKWSVTPQNDHFINCPLLKSTNFDSIIHFFIDHLLSNLTTNVNVELFLFLFFLFTPCVFQLPRKVQMGWRSPTTTVTSAWVTPPSTRRPANQRSWFPALTADAQVAEAPVVVFIL